MIGRKKFRALFEVMKPGNSVQSSSKRGCTVPSSNSAAAAALKTELHACQGTSSLRSNGNGTHKVRHHIVHIPPPYYCARRETIMCRMFVWKWGKVRPLRCKEFRDWRSTDVALLYICKYCFEDLLPPGRAQSRCKTPESAGRRSSEA